MTENTEESKQTADAIITKLTALGGKARLDRVMKEHSVTREYLRGIGLFIHRQEGTDKKFDNRKWMVSMTPPAEETVQLQQQSRYHPSAQVNGGKGGIGGKGKKQDWFCNMCGDLNFARNEACRNCGAAKPTDGSEYTPPDPLTFLSFCPVDDDAGMKFLSLTPQQQKMIAMKGTLTVGGKGNPTAVLWGRIKDVEELEASGDSNNANAMEGMMQQMMQMMHQMQQQNGQMNSNKGQTGQVSSNGQKWPEWQRSKGQGWQKWDKSSGEGQGGQDWSEWPEEMNPPGLNAQTGSNNQAWPEWPDETQAKRRRIVEE